MHSDSPIFYNGYIHFSLSCIEEGNGNPLQCSCLENPRDWGAWWAAVYGVARSRTRLKRLSSSSSLLYICTISPLSIPLLMTFRLLPCLGYCKQCCNKHRGAWIFSNHVFLSFFILGQNINSVSPSHGLSLLPQFHKTFGN